MQLVLDELTQHQATLVAVSPQVLEKTKATAKQNEVSFEVLSDEGNHVARRFGLVFSLPEPLRTLYKDFGIDLAEANGDDRYELPLPATYVIDTDGSIIYDFIDVDYTKRLEPSEILEVLHKRG